MNEKNTKDDNLDSNIHMWRDPPVPTEVEPTPNYEHGVPIAIDFGTKNTRIGYCNSNIESINSGPLFSFPTLVSKCRERKTNRTHVLVGNDIYLDTAWKSNSRSPFDSQLISNWDYAEIVLDYCFTKLGVSSEGCVDNPIIMTEPLACVPTQRKYMHEAFFEGYNVPKLAFGLDGLFSYYHNNTKSLTTVDNYNSNGVVVSLGYEATYVIPVLQGKGVLSHAKRLNWGAHQASNYLSRLLMLKYPQFPSGKGFNLAPYPASLACEPLINDYCYVSQDYPDELSHYLEFDNLNKKDIIVQVPFVESSNVKSEEEIARIAQRRKESGRRLQEQAAKARLEKLAEKEKDLEYYTNLEARINAEENKKEQRRMLNEERIKDLSTLQKMIKDILKYIRNAHKSTGVSTPTNGDENNENNNNNNNNSNNSNEQNNQDEKEEEVDLEAMFPLVGVPDDKLSDDKIKEKRLQVLQKANMEARKRVKAEKERARLQLLEEEKADKEFREADLSGWLTVRHERRQKLLTRIKEIKRYKADLNNRRSLASQQRMKNLTSLASDNTNKKRKRESMANGNTVGANGINGSVSGTGNGNGNSINNGSLSGDGLNGLSGGNNSTGNVLMMDIVYDDDKFGDNDNDWDAYKDIALGTENEEDEELTNKLRKIEAELLEFDETFTEEQTIDSQNDWSRSLIHAYLRGAKPFDLNSQAEQYQFHLNVERIRVPEVLFQPSMAGVDQAGIVEIVSDLLQRRLTKVESNEVMKDIFLTGGLSNLKGIKERTQNELIANVNTGSDLNVRLAQDGLSDAWRGAMKWGIQETSKQYFITREEYNEMGHEYIKEHGLGQFT